jgi:preprotein translocase subunit Sec63
MKTHYQTLGLKEGASQQEIKEAYERLSKELDPVANNNEDFFVEEYFKVREAYKALSSSSILATEAGARNQSAQRPPKPKLKEKPINIKNKKRKLDWIIERKRNILLFGVLVIVFKILIHYFMFNEYDNMVSKTVRSIPPVNTQYDYDSVARQIDFNLDGNSAIYSMNKILPLFSTHIKLTFTHRIYLFFYSFGGLILLVFLFNPKIKAG